MRVSESRALCAWGAGLVAVVFLAMPVPVGAESGTAGQPQAGLWTPKKVHFVFQGFTTRYSCEGLRDKVRKALLDLGARNDLQVTEGACSRPGGGPEPFPSVDVKMSVLEPVKGGSEKARANTVPAHWQTIDLRTDTDPLWQAEDCELLEQIKHTFVPLFATRAVQYHSDCVAHQVALGGTWLRAQVLMPDQKASETVASK